MAERISQELGETYCIVDKKKTGNLEPTIAQTKNGRYILKSKCAICGKRKTRFLKKQEASGLLSMLGIKTPLSNVPGLNLLFQEMHIQ